MTVKRTALYDLHIRHHAKMVEFAGYEMPIQYQGMGVMAEHLHTRAEVGVFDVSHMGQIFISGETDPANRLERIIPSALKTQKIGAMRYTVLLNDDGGIIDDLIVTRLSETSFYIVINAARITQDIPRLQSVLMDTDTLHHDQERILIALQGPKAEAIVTKLFPGAQDFKFMTSRSDDQNIISRCGYTGEDGFELSIPIAQMDSVLDNIFAFPEAKLIGLGARDSLRLEAGLCLYGHDLNDTLSPVEAGLSWVIQKQRRESADFCGAERILTELKEGTKTRRISLLPEGRAPIREGVEIQNIDGQTIGRVTSGTYSPCLEKPIAMAYVKADDAKIGTDVNVLLRGKSLPAKIAQMPFIESKTKKG